MTLGQQAAAPQPPRLRGTVKDPSGAVMASVDIVVIQGTNVKATKTNDLGVFAFDVPAGQYELAVTAPDFKVFRQTVRVTQNMAPLSLTLSLEGLTTAVEVVGNTNQVVVDAAQSLDATTLTSDQIADLPDDDDDLLAYLQSLAGGDGNAQLIIDGFENGRLPRRDQIAQIVIEPNSFNATGTGPRITIVSKTPGPTAWNGGASLQYRDSALNARTPHADNKPKTQRSVFSTNYGGPLIKGKLSMNIDVEKQQSDNGGSAIRAFTPGGPINETVYSPSTYDSVSISNNWYFSQNHTMYTRLEYDRSKSLNQGPGGFTLQERASDSSDHSWYAQFSDNKTLSPKMTNNFQASVNWGGSRTTPRTNAIAINVLDSFFAGGAQNLSVSRNSSFNISDTFRWTPSPKWNWQFNMRVNHQSNYNLAENNFLGTFTFSSLEDYLAGNALTFTQSSGNPVADTKQTDGNVSFNATYRISPNMSYSFGAQYAIQTHLKDYNNISPTTQFQVQLKKRHTISVGARLSYPNVAFQLSNWEQLIRGDGTTRQFNTVISEPTYPDPFAGGVTGTTTGVGNSLQLRDSHFVAPYTINTQLSLNEALPKNWRITTTFNMNRSVHQMRNRNINAPYPGTALDPSLSRDEIDLLRPYFPIVGRINRYESVGNTFQRNLTFTVQVPSKKVLKTQISGTFQTGFTWQDDDSAWENPYNVRADWARNDQRFRFQSSFSIRPPKVGSFNINFNTNTGRAYTITTGVDDNGDQSFSDRPLGVKRNSLRGPGQYTVNMNWNSPPLNVRKKKKKPVDAPTGAAGAPAAPAALSAQDQLIQAALAAGVNPANIQQLIASLSSQPGFIGGTPSTPTEPPSLLHPRITFRVNVQNLLNNTRVNGYSGVITSPVFGKPTGWGAGRSIQLSLNSSF